jgi:hypothetical protein
MMRGYDARTELDNALKKALEKAKEAYSARRNLEHSRRESINSTSGPLVGKG